MTYLTLQRTKFRKKYRLNTFVFKYTVTIYVHIANHMYLSKF